MANTEYNYSTLINKVIKDFDTIFDSLVTKGVEYSEGVVLTVADHRDSGAITTENYASYINTQLFKVKGLKDKAAGYIIENYSGQTQVGATPSITSISESTNYTIGLKVTNEGYYDTNSILTYTLETQALNLDSTALTDKLSNDVYTITTDPTKSGEKLYSSVKVARGTVTLANQDATATGNNGYGYTYADNRTYKSVITAQSTEVSEFKTSETIGTLSKTDYVSINLGTSIKTSGTVSVAGKALIEEGFIRETGDVTIETFEKTWAANTELVSNSGSDVIYIPKGDVKLDSSSLDGVSTSIGSSNSIVLYDNNAKGGYEISASLEKEDGTDITLKGTVTEGYFTPGKDGSSVSLGKISLGTAKKYIKAGSIAASTAITGTDDAPILTVTNDAGTVITTDATTGTLNNYAVTVKAEGEAAVSVTDGYVVAGTTAKATIDQSKTLYVKHGKYAINPTATVTFGSLTLSGNEYTVTATPVIGALSTTGLTEGFIKSGDLSIGTKTETQNTFRIAKGDASISNGLSVTFHNIDDGKGTADDAANNGKNVDIFVTTAPTDRDYFTVVSSAERDTFNAGYIASSSEIAIGESVTRYLPKADVKVSDVNGALVINVDHAGYLPSGLISASDLTETTIANASVGVIAKEGSSSIFSQTATSGAYKLTVAKGTVSAGYISGTTGEVTGDFYVAKGEVSATTTVSEIVAGDATKKDTKYIIDVSGSVTTTMAAPENGGFVTAADLKLNGADYTTENGANTAAIEKTIELDTATLSLDSSAGVVIGLGVQCATGIETVGADDGGFKIEPKIADNSKVKVTATEGYITSEDASELTFSNSANTGTNTPVYIKAGTGVTLTPVEGKGLANTLKPSANIENTVSGDYTISVSGNVTVAGTIDTGYYNESKKTLNQTVAVTGGSLSLAHGKVTSTVEATTDITAPVGAAGTVTAGQSIKFLDEGSNEQVPYLTIESDVDSITNSVTVTEGYIKNVDGDKTAATGVTTPANAKTTKKIKVVNLSTTEIDDTTATGGKATVYSVSVGQESAVDLSAAEYAGKVVDETKDAYSSYKTKITLTEHAMGSGVVAQMARLSSRLNGNLVRNQVSS